jgi:dUTP pyrophosphatase
MKLRAGFFHLWLQKKRLTKPSESGHATPTPPTMMQPANHHAQDLVPPLQIQILSKLGRVPTRGSAFAAGYDLYSAENATVPARGKGMISTGIAIAVPAGTCKYLRHVDYSIYVADPLANLHFEDWVIDKCTPDGRVAPRSGLAVKHSIHTGAGVIDADYRGEVKVILFNFSDIDFEIKEGDRIAQLILEKIYTPEIEVVPVLEETVRGDGGFGSTGGFGASAIVTKNGV